MLQNIPAMQRKRTELLAKARELLDNAEHRGMSEGEDTEYKNLIAEVDDLTVRIDKGKMQNSLEMATAPGGGRGGKGIYLADEDRAFLNYIRKGKTGITQDEERALVEDSTGGYLVSPAIEEELQRSLAKFVVVRQLASQRTITKDRILVRDITEAEVNWGKLETGAAITEATPAPSEDYKYIEDLSGLVKVGRDELEDSDYDLVNFMSDSFGRAIAEKENYGFLKGRGHSENEPDGITVDPTLVAATKATADDGVVTIDDFLQCIYEVPPKYRQGSAWVFNSTLELEIRKLRAEVADGYYGNYLWQPSLIAGAPPTFLGYPVYNQDDMEDLTGTQGVIAVFGNFQYGYRILDRSEITILRLNELYAEAGLVGFIVYRRVGGYLIKPSNKALVLLTEHSA
ncbi:MAG: phage major capsid protein [Dehalococcoidia bacterium]